MISYTNKEGRTLTGPTGFAAAVKTGYFRMVAYDGTITPAVDKVLARTLEADSSYRLVATIPETDSFGSGTCYVWARR